MELLGLLGGAGKQVGHSISSSGLYVSPNTFSLMELLVSASSSSRWLTFVMLHVGLLALSEARLREGFLSSSFAFSSSLAFLGLRSGGGL